ncbi:MAG: RNA-binding protein [Porticoccaceae bacterium]|nr:RNA-binding protein [Porticoccaceae bacterium]
MEKTRIDKWLWAARFFRTRALAKKAIEGGKIRIDGQRVKPSKDIKIGETLIIRQGWDEKEILVEKLSDQRRGAPEAARLYTETQDSLARREQSAAERKAAHGGHLASNHKPSKKERRQIHQFRDLDKL